MKPPPFRYHAPATLAQAAATLARLGEDAKVLAGGQSLIPLMNFRLASPAHLVDINRVADFPPVTVAEGVRVGAGVRHAELERDETAYAACPLLRQALVHVAHPAVRNRGTVCGSIAHADPAGELTAVLAVLGGTVHVVRSNGAGLERRDAPAATFFTGPLEADLAPTELVEAVTFPGLPRRWGSAFLEVARRHGDYALCGVAATVGLNQRGRIEAARVGLCSVGPVPVSVDVTEALVGAAPARADWDAAASLVRQGVRARSDLHASADYRRHLAGVLTARGLQAAVADARARARRRPR